MAISNKERFVTLEVPENKPSVADVREYAVPRWMEVQRCHLA